MPKTKLLQESPDGLTDVVASPLDASRVHADVLFRTALECCRQHQRYACVVAGSVIEHEIRAAARMVALADEILLEAAEAYCSSAVRPESPDDEPWWQRANVLWHASREYARRHQVSERVGRDRSAGAGGRLAELTLDYDLEASALLLMQQAIEAYRKCRPDAEFSPAGRATARS